MSSLNNKKHSKTHYVRRDSGRRPRGPNGMRPECSERLKGASGYRRAVASTIHSGAVLSGATRGRLGGVPECSGAYGAREYCFHWFQSRA